LRDAFTTLAIRIAGAGLAFAMQALLARLMAQADYGHFAMVWTWILALGSFASLGLAEVALRLLPRYAVRLRMRALRGFFNHGFRTTASVACAMSMMGVALASQLPLAESTRLIVYGVCLGLPVLALEFFLEGVARAMGWFRLTTVTIFIIRPLMIAACTLGLAAMGIALTGPLVALVLAVCIAATTFGLALVLRQRLARLAEDRRPSTTMRRFWISQSVPMLLASGLDDAVNYVDVVLVGLLLSPAQAAFYFVASRVLTLANLTQYAFYFVATRRFSLALADGDDAAAHRQMWQATWVTVATTLLAVVATLGMSPWLLPVFGAGYADATWLVAVLGLAQMARAMSGQAVELMLVLGRANELVLINAASLLLLAGALAIGLTTWGVAGGAAAVVGAMCLRSIVILWVVQQPRFMLKNANSVFA
jgi:O-antigen/teichoic acid export membrane protein